MAKFVCLQAGHQGVTSGATGAPGEQDFNVRIRDRVCAILLSKKNLDGSPAFMIQLVNANPTDAEIGKDFDLFLAIHYDANIYGTGGGFVDHPEPSTDGVTAESQRIDIAIESEYFNRTGIVNHPERSNANTRYYYMWSRLSLKTPCVIIECGVGLDPHDNVILNDTERVASALARGICKAFGVAYDEVVVPPQPPTVSCDRQNKLIYDIKAVLSGKGWVWTKNNKIKDLIAQSGL